MKSEEGFVPSPSESLESAIRDLRGNVAAIDEMWRESASRAELSEMAIALGEASHVMHRALIALDLPSDGGARSG